jgi:hypothetical protein
MAAPFAKPKFWRPPQFDTWQLKNQSDPVKKGKAAISADISRQGPDSGPLWGRGKCRWREREIKKDSPLDCPFLGGQAALEPFLKHIR